MTGEALRARRRARAVQFSLGWLVLSFLLCFAILFRGELGL